MERGTVVFYDLSQAHHPILLLRKAMPGITATLQTDRDLLAWGERGAFFLSLDRADGDLFVETLCGDPILAMASSGHRTLVLRQGRLEDWEDKQSRETALRCRRRGPSRRALPTW